MKNNLYEAKFLQLNFQLLENERGPKLIFFFFGGGGVVRFSEPTCPPRGFLRLGSMSGELTL